MSDEKECFDPVAVGYLINRLILVPVLGMVIYRFVPWLVAAFWFWLGSRYAKTDRKAIPAILISCVTGVLSLALYLRQFLLESDETRNLALAGLAQMYSAAAPLLLLMRLAVLFEPIPNHVGEVTSTVAQVLAVIFMAIVFTAGWFWDKKRFKNRS